MTEPKPPMNAFRHEVTEETEEIAPLELDPVESEDRLSPPTFGHDMLPDGEPTEVFSLDSLLPSVPPTPAGAVDFSTLSLDDAELEAALGALSDSPPPMPFEEPSEDTEIAPMEATPIEATPIEATPIEATPIEATPIEATPVAVAPIAVAPINPLVRTAPRALRAIVPPRPTAAGVVPPPAIAPPAIAPPAIAPPAVTPLAATPPAMTPPSAASGAPSAGGSAPVASAPSLPPEATPPEPVAPAPETPVAVVDAPISVAPEAIEVIEPIESIAPVALVGEASEELSADEVTSLATEVEFDGETELVFEEDDAAEIDYGVDEVSLEPDRGAILAATVTSRSRRVEVGELAFTADARAEVLARAELLVEQAEHTEDPRASAELLALASDLVDVGVADRTRAKALANEALARDPACLFASRLVRRFALADGDFELALNRCVSEAELPMSPTERRELLALTGELSAPIDPSRAVSTWASVAGDGAAGGALYGLFAAALGHEADAIGAALATFSARTEGVLSAAVNVARARLAEGAAETEAALAAIRDAVSGDATDAGAWLAMARIGLSHASATVFRDALRGLMQAGGAGRAAVAAGSVLRALDGVLGEPAGHGTVDDAGVVGWLVAHASRDSDAQVRASRAIGGERPGQWAARQGDDDSDAGRFHAVRAVAAGDGRWAESAARFVGGTYSKRVAGLAARASAVTEAESLAVDAGDAGVIGLGLRTAAHGIAGASWPEQPDASGWHRVAWIDRIAHEGSRDEAIAALESMDGQDVPLGVTVFAARAAAALRGDDAAAARALRSEALLASDGQRAAGQMLLASAFAAGAGETGGVRDALEAARGLAGDLAAAELVGLYSLRGEVEAEAAAALLDRAALGLKGLPSRVASVRAALRRGGTDSEAAAESVWKLWQKGDADAALGVLVLRASAGVAERAVSVVRAQAERVQGAGGGAGMAVWLQLTAHYELMGRHNDAVQAVARARSLALSDASLAQTEERLWLKAGMFAEVAERAFDKVKAAEHDEQRVAAYERLAELDRAFRGDVASSVLSYQAILEVSPGHMASLRTLERYFLENGRFDELLGIYERLVRYAQDPEDAAATAHMAARIASLQAEGDAGAGAEFLKLAMDRQAVDRRMLMAIELECRRTGDLSRFADVQLLAMDLATDPMEIATHGSRAGEALAALGLRADSLRAYERAVQAVPDHPVALAGLARERDAAGDAAGAATTMEALAHALRIPEHAVACYLRAASVWHSLGERDRALSATQSVLSIDVHNVEAFDRAMGLLRDADDRAGELNLIEHRTSDIDDPSFASLLVRAAELSEELGDKARAVNHWRAVHRLLPEHDGALRSVARLSVELEDWAAAADAMIRLARLVTDRSERAEIFFALGDIYDVHLPDTRRAEAAWRRVVQLSPEDDRTLARLADLYARIGEPALEADALEARAHLAPHGEQRLALLLRLARVLEEGVKDNARAEKALESARLERPTDLGMLRAFAKFYESQGSTVAQQVLLDRAANDLRPEVDADPMDASKMALLADILELRGKPDGARLAGAVSVSLDAPNERLRALAPMGSVAATGAGALNPDALELLSPPTVFSALREVLSRTGDVIEKLMPFDARTMRAEKLGARPHPLRAEAERWARLLELGSVEVYMAGQVPGGCLAVSRAPCAIVVPATAMATPATRFAVARAMLLNALYLAPALRLTPAELTLMVNAVLRQFEPMYRAADVDPAQLDDLARKVSRTLPKDRHADLSAFAFEVIEAKGCDGEAIQAGANELGNRLALLATGDVAGAIASLSPEGMPPATAFREVVNVSRLVRVALSDRFLEARQLAGADKA